MKSNLIGKLVALGSLTLALSALLALMPGTKTGVVKAGSPVTVPLLSCANMDGSDDGPYDVTISDIVVVVSHYYQSYSDAGYMFLFDLIDPYNPGSPPDTGQILIDDIVAVVNQYYDDCPLVDTQIAKATLAIGEPAFEDVLCDPALATPMNCGGDAQFLTENASFLAGKGYRRGSTDVDGQGIHYVNFSLWDGVFNPVRPEGLVYNGGKLMAQLYYSDGDIVGWGGSPSNNDRAVNTDALPCTAGCGWDGAYDGWHWHDHLCTFGIGTTGAVALPSPSFTSQTICKNYAAGFPWFVTCTFPDTDPVNFNCTWDEDSGWMGHLWNWLPNANYTNAVDPNGMGLCQVALCATGESNGRFADCFPDTGGWNAYNCPQ